MINFPSHWYFTAHLVLKCNYNCSYCIQKFDDNKETINKITKDNLSTEDWINGLSKFKAPFLVLSGGEVTIKSDTAEIACAVADNFGHVEIGTNLYKDPQPIIDEIIKQRKFNVVIGTSYHPSQCNKKLFLYYIKKILDSEVTLNTVAIVDTPDGEGKKAYDELAKLGVPKISLNPFQGFWDDVLYPEECESYCGKKYKKNADCRTSIIAIGPNGNIYPCAHLCYINSDTNLGNIKDLDENRIMEFIEKGIFCSELGFCNPCTFGRIFPTPTM